MMASLASVFSYAFMVRALAVGLLVSLCAALLGVCLVLKRYSMIGDGLSHVGFGALSISMALNMAPLAVSVPVVVLAAFWLLRLSERGKLKGDAAIALVSCSALAFGVIVTSLAGGMNADVHNYMFGSVLAMSRGDVVLSVCLSLAVLVLYYGVMIWNSWFWAANILKQRESMPLAVLLRDILINSQMQAMDSGMPTAEGIKYALIVVATVPILMIYPFIQKYFTKGVMIGAVKE